MSDGFVEAILSPLQPRQRSLNFIVDEPTNFINSSALFQDIFLGLDPYSNNDLKNLGAACTCFTDLAYWQFAYLFQRRPRDESQLQVPNASLSLIWTEIVKGFQSDPQQVQRATSRITRERRWKPLIFTSWIRRTPPFLANSLGHFYASK